MHISRNCAVSRWHCFLPNLSAVMKVEAGGKGKCRCHLDCQRHLEVACTQSLQDWKNRFSAEVTFESGREDVTLVYIK